VQDCHNGQAIRPPVGQNEAGNHNPRHCLRCALHSSRGVGCDLGRSHHQRVLKYESDYFRVNICAMKLCDFEKLADEGFTPARGAVPDMMYVIERSEMPEYRLMLGRAHDKSRQDRRIGD
jgi:hypothetical protein